MTWTVSYQWMNATSGPQLVATGQYTVADNASRFSANFDARDAREALAAGTILMYTFRY